MPFWLLTGHGASLWSPSNIGNVLMLFREAGGVPRCEFCTQVVFPIPSPREFTLQVVGVGRRVVRRYSEGLEGKRGEGEATEASLETRWTEEDRERKR